MYARLTIIILYTQLHILSSIFIIFLLSHYNVIIYTFFLPVLSYYIIVRLVYSGSAAATCVRVYLYILRNLAVCPLNDSNTPSLDHAPRSYITIIIVKLLYLSCPRNKFYYLFVIRIL